MCSVCQKRESTYWITSLEPAIGFCDTCKPTSRKLALQRSQCGESEPDIEFENDYPKDECYLCGNKNFEELNRSSISKASPVLNNYGEKFIVLPDSFEFERWTCKYEFGCGKTWQLRWPIDEILIVRFQDPLFKAGYKTIGDLSRAKPEELLKIKGIGKRAILDIENSLRMIGVKWGHGALK